VAETGGTGQVTAHDAEDGRLKQAEIKILEGDRTKVRFDGYRPS